jgi:hypothetical protein
VRFDELFLLVFRERTVDDMFVGFWPVGHSDFLFVFQIWLSGPAEVYSRVACVRDREAAILRVRAGENILLCPCGFGVMV